MNDVFASNYLGQIEVASGSLLVCDPCYLPEVPGDDSTGTLWAAVTVAVPPGSTADVFADLEDLGSWGKRVSALRAVFKKTHGRQAEAVAGVAGVDSGQMSMLDGELIGQWGGDERGAADDFEPARHSGEFNYQGVCDLTLGAAQGGVIDKKIAASSSGIGDGSYPVVVMSDQSGAVVAVEVRFLEDDDGDEEL